MKTVKLVRKEVYNAGRESKYILTNTKHIIQYIETNLFPVCIFTKHFFKQQKLLETILIFSSQNVIVRKIDNMYK